MKKFINIVLALTAICAFAPVASAQSQDIPDGISMSKSVSGPKDGVYTISLETYVTGAVTIENKSVPADIVMVLDVSSSMTQNSYGSYSTRLAALRAAALDFIDIIDKNDEYEYYNSATDNKKREGGRLGNQMAIVPFGGSLATSDDLAPLGLTPLSSITTLTSKINGLTSTISKTNPNVGLQKAQEYIEGIASDRESFKTVVLFTDGCPAESGATTFKAEYAYNAVNTAYEIKHLTYKIGDDTYNPSIFTIGLFTDLGNNATQVNNYMNYTSSNYVDAKATAYSTRTSPESVTYSAGDGTYGGEYYQMVGDDNLDEIFKTVAKASGGSTIEAASQSSVVVDVVTSSFTIPETAGDVTAYSVPCTQASKEATEITFETERSKWTKLENVVTTVGNTVTATGFDYAENWCGWDEKNNSAHGAKLLIEIPITINEDAVGGPSVKTNDETKSVFKIVDKDGNEKGTYQYLPSPTLALPVNIHIVKVGLKDGESARFTLIRSKDEEFSSSEEFQTVILTKGWDGLSDENGNPMIKLRGLDPTYYYKIKEDAGWSWTYEIQTENGEIKVYGQDTNPFTFENKKKDTDTKNSEASVHNVFGQE